MHRIFILCIGGSYSSWIEWLLWYGHKTQWEMVNASQLLPDGSSHGRRTEEFEKIEGYAKIKHPQGYVQTEEAILHARSITNVDLLTYRCITFQSKDNSYSIRDAIDLIGNSNFTGIYIDINNDDMRDIVFLNAEKKIESITFYFDRRSKSLNTIRKWKPTANSLSDLENWERRELISTLYPGMYQDYLDASLEDIPPSVLAITIDDILYSDVTVLVKKIFSHAGIPLREESLAHIKQEHAKMISLQESLKELAAIKTIINACLVKQNVGMPPISKVSESIVQRRLRDLHGIDLRWYGLNDWPTKTGELIERMIDKS